jgi:hypothetical protein
VKLVATNIPLPYVTDIQALSEVDVRAVHDIPSGLVITRLPVSELNVPLATATNKPFPKVTLRHCRFTADVRAVQVIPSGLVITWLPVPVV